MSPSTPLICRAPSVWGTGWSFSTTTESLHWRRHLDGRGDFGKSLSGGPLRQVQRVGSSSEEAGKLIAMGTCRAVPVEGSHFRTNEGPGSRTGVGLRFRTGRWPTSRPILLLLMIVGLLIAGGSSHAAVVLKFVPSAAPPGATVDVTSVAMSLEGESYEVFLAPSQWVADRVSSAGARNDTRLVRIGRFASEGSGADRFTFAVPPLRPGRYVAVLCADCGARAATFSALGRFRVMGSSQLPATGGHLGVHIAAAVLLLALGHVLLRRKRVQSSEPRGW